MTEQPPSKDVCTRLRMLTGGLRLLGYTAAELIAELEAELERRQAKVMQLRTTLTGIQSCSTCEACRGAATLALGGAAPEPCARHGQIIQTDCPDCERALGRSPEPPLRPDGMPEPSLDVLKRVAARMSETAPDTAYLAQWAVDQIEEHDQSFDLRWKADMRAIKRWQEAHPGNDLTWPDHADLCVWLLEQVDARAAQPAGEVATDAERWQTYLKCYDREEMVAAEWDGPDAITAFIDSQRLAQPPGDVR